MFPGSAGDRNCGLRQMRQRVHRPARFSTLRPNRAQLYRQQRMQRMRMLQRRRQANRAKRQRLM